MTCLRNNFGARTLALLAQHLFFATVHGVSRSVRDMKKLAGIVGYVAGVTYLRACWHDMVAHCKVNLLLVDFNHIYP